jgi:hypothetical protein
VHELPEEPAVRIKSQLNVRWATIASTATAVLTLAATIVVTTVVTTGCATGTLMYGAPNMKTTVKQGDVVLKDSIIALGKPDDGLAKQIGSADAVVFVGKAQSYLLHQGGDVLLDYAQHLDSNKLTLITDSNALYLRDKTIWGQLSIAYAMNGAPALSAEEKAALARLHFRPNSNGGYTSSVAVRGAVYPAMDLKDKGFTQLQHARDLVFHEPPTTESTPNLGKAALLPVAVAVDVVTAPLQLLGFGLVVFCIASDGAHH